MCFIPHVYGLKWVITRDVFITRYNEKWSMLTCDEIPCNLLWYGTHQLQLKRDTRVPRVCRPRNAHALLLHACSFVCFYLLHHEHVRKHTRYVCMNTRFFIHAHASHGVTCTQLHLYIV